MNSVNLIGRLTKDVDLRYTQSGLAVGRFSIAIDRPSRTGRGRHLWPFGLAAHPAHRQPMGGRDCAKRLQPLPIRLRRDWFRDSKF